MANAGTLFKFRASPQVTLGYTSSFSAHWYNINMVASRVIARTISVVLLVLALGPVLISEVGAQTADQANSSCQPAKERDGKKCNTTVQGAIIEGICGGGSCNAKSSTGTDGNKEAVNENTTEIQKGAIEKANEVNAESISSETSSSKFQGRLSDNPDAGMGNASTADSASNAPGSGTNAAGERFESTRPALDSGAPDRGWDDLRNESAETRESILRERDTYVRTREQASPFNLEEELEKLDWSQYLSDSYINRQFNSGRILDLGWDDGFGYKSNYIFVSNAELGAGSWGGSSNVGMGSYSNYGSPNFGYQFDPASVTGFGQSGPNIPTFNNGSLTQAAAFQGNTSAVVWGQGAVPSGLPGTSIAPPAGLDPTQQTAWTNAYTQAFNACGGGISCAGQAMREANVAAQKAGADVGTIAGYMGNSQPKGFAETVFDGMKSVGHQITSAAQGAWDGFAAAFSPEQPVQVADAGPTTAMTDGIVARPVDMETQLASRYGLTDRMSKTIAWNDAKGNKTQDWQDYNFAEKTGQFGEIKQFCYGDACSYATRVDRGPYVGEREIDLNYKLAEKLKFDGVKSVETSSTGIFAPDYQTAAQITRDLNSGRTTIDQYASDGTFIGSRQTEADYTPSSKLDSFASVVDQPGSLTGRGAPSVPATALAEQAQADYIASQRGQTVLGSDENARYAPTGSFNYNPPINTAANTDAPSTGGWTAPDTTYDASLFTDSDLPEVYASDYFDNDIKSPLPVSFEVRPVSGGDIPTLVESRGSLEYMRTADGNLEVLNPVAFDDRATVLARADVTPDTLIAINDFDNYATAVSADESAVARAIDLPGPETPASPFGLGDDAVATDATGEVVSAATLSPEEASSPRTLGEIVTAQAEGALEKAKEFLGFGEEEVVFDALPNEPGIERGAGVPSAPIEPDSDPQDGREDGPRITDPNKFAQANPNIAANEKRGELGTQSGAAIPRQGTLNQVNPSQEKSDAPGAAGTQSGPAASRPAPTDTAQGPAAPATQQPPATGGGAGAGSGSGSGDPAAGRQGGQQGAPSGGHAPGGQQGGGGMGDMLKGLTDMLKGGGGKGGGGQSQQPPVTATPNNILATPVPSTQFAPPAPLTPAPQVSVVANPNPTQRGATSIVSWTAVWADAQPATLARECAVIDATGKTHVDHASSTDSFETPKLSQGVYFVVGCKQSGGKLGSAIVLVRVVGDTQAPIAPPTAALASYESSSGQSQAGNELAAALGVPGANQPTQQLNVACDPNSPSYFDCLTGKMLFVDKLY